jgi:hypothetical protein
MLSDALCYTAQAASERLNKGELPHGLVNHGQVPSAFPFSLLFSLL